MPVQELQLTRFYPAEASEQDWSDILKIRLNSFQENNPGDQVPPQELMRKQISMFEDNPFFMLELYLVRNTDQTTVGLLLIALPRSDAPEAESQKHMGMVIPDILPEYRRQGFGTIMLKKTIDIFRERGLTLIQGDTATDAGRAFAEKFGATVGLEQKISRLYLKDVDWDLIEAWSDEGSKANPDVRIEMFEGLPDEAEIEAYARLYSELINQVPFEELEGIDLAVTPEKLRVSHQQEQERGDIHIVRITREADGTISGITEIFHNPQRPHLIIQEITGVQEKHRGRGLGKWLKADMLLYIRDKFPDVEYINTGNATSNAPMLSINRLYRK